MPRFLFQTLAAGGLMLAAAGMPVQACTMASWSGTSGSDGLSVGTPDEEHRRFRGQCGLKVVANGGGRYVEDGSPDSETLYFARFYVFVGDVDLNNGGWVDLYKAYGGGRQPNEELGVRLQKGDDGPELVLRAREGSQVVASDPVPVGTGWQGVALSWKQASRPGNGEAALELNGSPRAKLSRLNNSNSVITLARMGSVAANGARGEVYFDAFQSQRKTPTEALVAGDATGDEVLGPADLVAVVDEINGVSLADGQPDCNGDGTVDADDLDCLADRIISQ